jgi:competence protein ComEA
MRLERSLILLALGAALNLPCSQTLAQTPIEQQRAPIQSSADPLDINTATAQQLNALPGFGPAYTRRVIAGRPYSAKNQLVTRGVIPQDAYARIADLIVAHRVAK